MTKEKERNQDCDKRVAKAMYDLQEFCKSVDRCLAECPHCSEADFCTITIDGLIPSHWNISKEHIEQLERDEEDKGMHYAMMASLIELKERRDGGSNNSDAREDFMHTVYCELSDDADNCRANRIIDASDEYVEEIMRLEYERNDS